MDNNTKTCKDCNTDKPLEEYSKGFNKTYGRYYYQSYCKTCSSARALVWWSNNRETVAKRKRTPHYKETAAKAHTQWIRNNPEKTSKRNHEYRARKDNATTYEIRESFLSKLYKSDCVVCGNSKDIVADHIIPLSRGGDNSEANLQPLCRSCNSSKKDKTMTEWLKG